MKKRLLLAVILSGVILCFGSILGITQSQAQEEDVIRWGSSINESWEELLREWTAQDMRVKSMVRSWGFSTGSESMGLARSLLLDEYRSALISGFGSPLTPELLMLIDVMMGDFWMVMWLDSWIDDLRSELDLNTESALDAAWEKEESVPKKLTPKAMSELIRTVGYLLEMERILSGAHKRFMDDWDILRELKEECDYIPEKAEQILKDQGLVGVSDAEIAARIKERISGQASLEQARDLIDEILHQYGVFEISGPGAKKIIDILNGME